MSDTFKVQSFETLLGWILKEYEQRQSIFGIHRSLFFTPRSDSPYSVSNLFGSSLATPIGPAAGPHTQLAQNIIAAWLSGGRFIELKTVQILDELEIPRPCIDMEDEGYNVEWSQELKLDEAAHEYVNAWALVHVLPRLLGFEDLPLGTIFNLSVGYTLEGIQSQPVTRFLDRMNDAGEELGEIQKVLEARFPRFAGIQIPSQISNNVTLSTMHGCPPDEIERIATYLLEKRGLHTTVKMNPTLLGKETLTAILHDDLGYTEIDVPDAGFEHDLKYPQALELIRSLEGVASRCNLDFGVKLSNTLAVHNHKPNLPGGEMYMSGRALYPITLTLFDKLSHEFGGKLKVSYSAGADALNVAELFACGARTVTVASDLLKPGGYARLGQYLQNLEAEMARGGVSTLDELAADRLEHVKAAAAAARKNPRYHKEYAPYGLPKVSSGLDLFDCITAPCMESCAVHQDVPEYAWWIAQGNYDKALEVILSRNPLPGVTGYVCTHLCQTNCTRNNYEAPVSIRVLKRIAAEKGQVKIQIREKTGHKAAIVGAGPSGFSAAYFLALNGIETTIFEAKDQPGGMMRLVPAFRLPTEIIEQDVQRILDLGVQVQYNEKINRPPETLLSEGYDAVYVAAGFQKNTPLDIEGVEGPGVYSALEVLESSRRGEYKDLGRKALVIGGGDTAMDATRTARRLTGNPATIVYRRTIHEMPATPEELEGALEEGNELRELVSPLRVIREGGRVVGLECIQNHLGEPGADGRRKPVPTPGTEFVLPADSILLAVGQLPELSFTDGSKISLQRNGSIAVDASTGLACAPAVYAGGDAVDGPESIIAAAADGRRAAEAVCQQLGVEFTSLPAQRPQLEDEDILKVKQARALKVEPNRPEMLPAVRRQGFDLIEATLSDEAAQAEAQRCVQCTTICDKCVEVCPNRANLTYFVEPFELSVPVVACEGTSLKIVDQQVFRVDQGRQILHVDDFCNECGNCDTFCVHHGKPYREKPRLFLNETDWAREQENAYYIRHSETGWLIRSRAGERSVELRKDSGGYTYEDGDLRVRLTTDFQARDLRLKHGFEEKRSLAFAAEMAVILEGVCGSLAYLPLGQ